MKKFIKKLFKLDKEEQRRTTNLNPVYVARKIDIEKVDLTPLENSINEVSTKLDTFIGEVAQEQITQNNKITTIEKEQQTQNTNISSNTQKIQNHNQTNNTQNTRLDAIDKINNDQNAEIGRIEGKFDSETQSLKNNIDGVQQIALTANTRGIMLDQWNDRQVQTEAISGTKYYRVQWSTSAGMVRLPLQENIFQIRIHTDNMLYIADGWSVQQGGVMDSIQIYFHSGYEVLNVNYVEIYTRTKKT